MRVFIKSVILLTTTIFCGVQVVWAQLPDEKEVPVVFSVPSIALLDVEPEGDNSLDFSIAPSMEAGASPEMQHSFDNELWLNYTSAINNSSRSIKAKIDGGNLPDGMTLKVRASAYQGTGEGVLGNSIGQVELSQLDQIIITGIGNCYTGDGTGNGHQLFYEVEINDFSELGEMNEIMIYVLYTISE